MKDMERYKDYAPVIVRIGISLVFLWFGINQLFDSSSFLGYLPEWSYNNPLIQLNPATLIFFNGSFEAVFGLLLLLGLLVRLSSLLLALHLLGIAISLGYNDVFVRDIGLVLATLSVFLNGADRLSLNKKIRIKELKAFNSRN